MTQKNDETIKGLQEEIERLHSLIQQLRSEIHTANLERYKHD
jgi:prefoldin subunit 5